MKTWFLSRSFDLNEFQRERMTSAVSQKPARKPTKTPNKADHLQATHASSQSRAARASPKSNDSRSTRTRSSASRSFTRALAAIRTTSSRWPIARRCVMVRYLC